VHGAAADGGEVDFHYMGIWGQKYEIIIIFAFTKLTAQGKIILMSKIIFWQWLSASLAVWHDFDTPFLKNCVQLSDFQTS